MKTLILAILVSLPVTATAAISGPTSSSSGNFTLEWVSGNELSELDGDGVVVGTYTSGSRSFSKPVGTYSFRETWCGYIPPYVTEQCIVIDNHQVVVTSGDYPQGTAVQAQYEFEIRAADFDGNGRKDLYVKRLTPGPADGSQRSYVVWNNSNGTISTTALSSTYASAAQNAPINTVLNLMQVDVNGDGFADHIIERIDQVMGYHLEQELVVFAPGTRPNKNVPQGNTQIDENFETFFVDVARWMNDQDYVANNFFNSTIPTYQVGYICVSYPWFDSSYNFLPTGVCYPYVYVTGFQTAQYGVNFSAVSAVAYLNTIASAGSIPSESNLWQLAKIVQGVIGVYPFGFDASGNRQTTNTGGINDAYDRFHAYSSFIYFAMAMAADESSSYPKLEHDYKVQTSICSTSNAWCTLANIACWNRHYHAPDKRGGYAEPAANGDEAVLDGPLGTDQPIKVGVGTAAGLPPNATGNITLPGHILHSSELGQWGTCPKTVPNQGNGTPPAACNQVYREPYVKDGKVWMRTRGSGENSFDWVNQWLGPGMFKELDQEMKAAILNKSNRLCPSL
jgi:hypothetical protein